MKKFCSVLLAMLLVIAMTACGQKTATWQEQYDLGVKYLSEGNYEEAIIAFTAAIEIDPQRADGYQGLASAYLKAGSIEHAREILQQGIEATRDMALQEFLDGMSEETTDPEPEASPGESNEEDSTSSESSAAASGETTVANGALTLVNETPEYGVLRVFRGEATGENRFVKGDELTANGQLTTDDYVIFEVTDIAEGYQIAYVGWTREDGVVVDVTASFVNGVYGTMGSYWKPGVWTLRMAPT